MIRFCLFSMGIYAREIFKIFKKSDHGDICPWGYMVVNLCRPFWSTSRPLPWFVRGIVVRRYPGEPVSARPRVRPSAAIPIWTRVLTNRPPRGRSDWSVFVRDRCFHIYWRVAIADTAWIFPVFRGVVCKDSKMNLSNPVGKPPHVIV